MLVLQMFFTFIVGTAGSGKSLLTASLEKWLVGSDLSVTVVNLDPGVDSPPYTSDVDIREYVDYGEVMSSFGLGPNGALVASLDMAVSSVDDIREEIIDTDRDYVLVDCPGQMELFAYRRSGIEITGSFSPDTSFLAFLFDSTLVSQIGGFLSISLLATSVQLRLNIPIAHIITKIDLLKPHQVEDVLTWREDPFDAIESETGMAREFSLYIGQMIEGLGQIPLVPVSALTGEGLDLLSAQISRIFEAGEDWSI